MLFIAPRRTRTTERKTVWCPRIPPDSPGFPRIPPDSPEPTRGSPIDQYCPTDDEYDAHERVPSGDEWDQSDDDVDEEWARELQGLVDEIKGQE